MSIICKNCESKRPDLSEWEHGCLCDSCYLEASGHRSKGVPEFMKAKGSPIQGLKLSPRAKNALSRAGINTAEELAVKSREQLWCLRGIGKKVLKEIEEKFSEKYGDLGIKII